MVGTDCLASRDINGIPNWENPTNTAIDVKPNILLSPSAKKETSPMSKQDVSPLVTSPSAVLKPMTLPTPYLNNPHSKTNRLESMVIECDEQSQFSTGDITFDESVNHDEQYIRSQQQNYHTLSAANLHGGFHHNPVRHSPYDPPHLVGGSPSFRGQTATTSKEHHRHSTHQQQQAVPVSPALSLEDEEMRQLELALERSLQDYGSVMSSERESLMSTADRSRMSTSSSPRESHDLGMAGCHLSMMAQQHRGLQEPGTDPGKGFVWKRDGKLWRRVPVSSDSLHAIDEENEIYRNRQYQDHSSSGVEDHPYEECRSGNRYHDNFAYHGDGGHPASSTLSNIDPEVAAARLRELEREKEMLELAMKRSMNMEENRLSGRMSIRPRIASQASCSALRPTVEGGGGSDRVLSSRNAPRRALSSRSRDMDAAGCHLQMQSMRLRKGDDHLPASSMHSIESEGSVNMVWKRGPNGAWGRFPEGPEPHHTTEEALDDEDAQVAEALRRSLQQM